MNGVGPPAVSRPESMEMMNSQQDTGMPGDSQAEDADKDGAVIDPLPDG